MNEEIRNQGGGGRDVRRHVCKQSFDGVGRLWLTCALFSASCPAAEPYPGWDVSGSNTLRLETYNNSGDDSASPYPFEGGQYFDEWGANFLKRNSPYDLWRGQFYGVINASDYRSTDRGVVPERMNLTHEKGDGALPHRIEGGDYFSYYSYLTLQRSLKGLQIELQPHSDNAGLRHSIQFTTGTAKSSWHDFAPHEDILNGASWLIDNGRGGALALNLVNSHRDGEAALGTLDRDQYTFSLGGEHVYRTATQRLSVEGEAAHLIGDHDDFDGAGSGQDADGNGFFSEMRGQDQRYPLDYRVRFEHYDRHFRPRAGVIQPDRRSVEFHAGWRFPWGLRLRGRVQAFEDAFDSTNSTDTRTVGVALSGPLFTESLNNVNGSIDVFVQGRDDELDMVDQRTVNANIHLTKPLPYDWFGRLSVFVQDLNDRNATDADLWTNQYLFSADHGFSIAGFSGIVTPGLLYRNQEDSVKGDDWSPTLALHLARGSHSLGFNYGFLTQVRHLAGGVDVDTHTVALDYRYTMRQHTFGVDMNLYDRDADPGRYTDAYRVGVLWTYSFDRSAVAARTYGQIGAAPAAVAPGADLVGLAPGVALNEATDALARTGVTGGTAQAGLVVYEYALLGEIEQRQRLALLHDGGSLRGSALVIDLDDVGNVDSVAQTFERVRKALIDRYGPPASTFEEGEFTATLADDVNTQRFIRLTEWSTAAGVLRLGIPRRLDGQVRIEVQHQRGFAQPRETMWSIESVR